jgi:tRNA(Arg) A34 adenosine deaminase TadA
MTYLTLAAKYAGDNNDRNYRIGCIGIRKDGTIIYSRNIRTRNPEPWAHAEARLSKKLDYNAKIYVARIDCNGVWKNARPCGSCLLILKQKKVLKIYYTIRDKEYGVLVINKT